MNCGVIELNYTVELLLFLSVRNGFVLGGFCAIRLGYGRVMSGAR